MDRYRDRRSPDRDRGRFAPRDPATDSYVPAGSRAARPRSRSPGGYRRRSRSPPPPRMGGDSWRSRPRSPPPARRYDPRDDYPAKDSYRGRGYTPADSYYDDRGPRARSPPLMKRGRDLGMRGGMRSPPPAKRERLDSPPRDYIRPRSPARAYSPPRDRPSYRPRSRSPRRDDRPEPYKASTWRRHSPSPRMDVRSGEGSGRNSVATSRRSSPRPYARRPVDAYEADEMRGLPASTYRSPRPRSPPRSPVRRRESPPPRARSPYEAADAYVRPVEREYPNGEAYPTREAEPPVDYRDRPPPTGPSGSRYAMSPPTGPAAGTPASMSAHNRPGSSSIMGAPSHPRGAYGGFRGRGGPPRDFSRDYPPPRRGSWGGAGFGRGGPPGREPFAPREFDARGSPSARGRDAGFGNGANFRGSSNSTSTTYPRSQRFNNQPQQHLDDLGTVKAGGERLPALHDTSKADKLEEEAARLRKLIDEKESVKRQGLREWDKLEREASTASLRSELAEEHLRSLNGEGEVTAAF